MRMKGMRCFSWILTAIVVMMPIMEVNAKGLLQQDNQEMIEEKVHMIEEELNNADTSVERELEAAITKFRLDLANEENVIEQVKLQELIIATEELLEQYKGNGLKNNGRSTEADDLNATVVATVCAYFSSNGYLLAYELLVHAETNTILDSTYRPHYGDRAQTSNVIAAIKKNTTDVTGSDSFPNSGTKEQRDLYYAIHSFSYKYTYRNNQVIISDRYDYDANDIPYLGLEGVAVDAMAYLQDIGYLTPYYIMITV